MSASTPPKIVLHIDDDDDDREMVKHAIELHDKSVIMEHAVGGQEGLLALKQAKQNGRLPALIILDINMPGMDGRQVLKEIQEDSVLATIPLVLFTTSSSELDKLFANSKGVELITKPPQIDKLSQAVERFLKLANGQ